jgi:hypothetical protein
MWGGGQLWGVVGGGCVGRANYELFATERLRGQPATPSPRPPAPAPTSARVTPRPRRSLAASGRRGLSYTPPTPRGSLVVFGSFAPAAFSTRYAAAAGAGLCKDAECQCVARACRGGKRAERHSSSSTLQTAGKRYKHWHGAGAALHARTRRCGSSVMPRVMSSASDPSSACSSNASSAAAANQGFFLLLHESVH